MFDGALVTADECFSFGREHNLQPAKALLSRPAPGRSLGATVTRVERPIREAVKLLSRTVAIDRDALDFIFGCTPYGPGCFREPDDLRLSWFLVNAAILHAFVTQREHVGPLLPALEWFLGNIPIARRLLGCFPQQIVKAADDVLRSLEASEGLHDLLPYVLEPLGHVTRNSLESCDKAQRRRDVKKDTGVYYTPSDVAEFMVGSLVALSETEGSWIDPACGTGVFLRAVIAQRRNVGSCSLGHDLRAFALSSVFGIDRSALATDLAAFVVLNECFRGACSEQPHFHFWQKIKGNIACMDSLRLMPLRTGINLYRDRMQQIGIKEIFPAIGEGGFDHVVMNPPYAKARIDQTLQTTWHSYAGIAVGQTGDTQLAFTEMLWRFTSNSGSSAAVLPLSIGTNTTRAFLSLRKELLCSSGTKEFLFFDREPQALFGEDIKTRNLILIRQGLLAGTAIRTSRLLKWTAAQRPFILTRDRLVEIPYSQCTRFIPKLGTKAEMLAYCHLRSAALQNSAAPFVPRGSRLTLDEAAVADDTIRRFTLLVSSTAYNFINCFYANALPIDPPQPYSSSPINALSFGSEHDAYAAFALISSRLCFWLWHVEGDGFHLTSDFLKRLPIWGALGSEGVKQSLVEHGRQLWQASLGAMVSSVNGGKQTFSFHCGYDHPSTNQVERVIFQQTGLSNKFSDSLDAFIHATVSIDGKRRMRRAD